MASIFQIGSTVQFMYNGKLRHVKVEKVTKTARVPTTDTPNVVTFTGWDTLVNYPTGGYRQFNVAKITDACPVG